MYVYTYQYSHLAAHPPGLGFGVQGGSEFGVWGLGFGD